MYLNNYQLPIKKETLSLILLFVFSALIRIPIILIYGDTSLENEWRVIVENLKIHGTLAFSYYDANLKELLLPNVLMPPLYAYYLYFFSFLNLEEQNYIQLILFSQILLSSISIVIFYKINKIFFTKNISFYSSILFSLIPLHLYACGQISSISLQIFFTILFFYFFFQLAEKKNLSSIISLSFIGGLLLLLRGEFIVILLLSLLFLLFFFRLSIKNIILILLITLITISPYLIRNIVVFEKIIIIKSLGLNLWKGNNPKSTVEGYGEFDNELIKKINSIPKNKYYGINYDNVFLEQAKKNIKEDPKKYFTLFIKKFISFLFIDVNSSNPNYYNPLHYLPILILSITSLIGIILSDKKSNKLNYLILIFFINITIFSIFFILPRYKLAIIPMQIIFTNVLIDYIRKRFFSTISI